MNVGERDPHDPCVRGDRHGVVGRLYQLAAEALGAVDRRARPDTDPAADVPAEMLGLGERTVWPGRRDLEPVVLKQIAQVHGKSPAQVLIRYCIEKNTIVIPKSVHKDRIRENMDVFDYALTSDEIARLDALDEGLATGWDPTNAP